MKDIIIRKAKMSDLEVILAHNQAMAMETENRMLDADTVHAGVKAVLEDDSKGFYLVAESSDGVVGNLMITYEWSDWRNGMIWWYQSVFVKKEWRGKDIFGIMYRNVMNMAKENNVKELRLYVEKTNIHAQKVYASLGMEESHYAMYEVIVD